MRAALLLMAVGCGSSGSHASALRDCAPAHVGTCAPTDAAGVGCNVATNPGDGRPIVAVTCSGGDARGGCFPDDHQLCVDACRTGASACQ